MSMKNIPGLLFCMLLLTTVASCAQKPRKQVIEPPFSAKQLSGYSQATFAAGCFWHEEALFESIKGVKEAVSGYAGGKTDNPNYESIETGTTGYAETVNVYYDSSIVSYPTLLKVYFSGQDPTQVNGQGPDHGTQYRSIGFYRNNKEKQLLQDYIKGMKTSGNYNAPIVVEVMPFTKFWQAEDYHQNYIDNNPGSVYVQMVSVPEIKKLQKEYPELIKPDHIY